MQNFIDIPSNEPFVTSRILLLSNDKSIMSNFAGTAFPTTNLQVGMFCYRTDQLKMYQLVDNVPTWTLILDVAKGWIANALDLPFTPIGNITAASVGGALAELDTEKVNTSEVATTATANKLLKLNAEGDLPANAVSATVLETARSITISGDATSSPIDFDGSKNITVEIALENVGIAGTYTKVTTDANGRVFSGEDALASDIVNTPAGDIIAETVQGAINELDSEKAPKASPSVTNLTVDSVINSPEVLRIEDGMGVVQGISVASVTTSGQITSTEEEGTAPLVVASTTKVANFNADKLDGFDAGNADGDIPVNNGVMNTNLNAEKVGGFTFNEIDGNAFLYSLIF